MFFQIRFPKKKCLNMAGRTKPIVGEWCHRSWAKTWHGSTHPGSTFKDLMPILPRTEHRAGRVYETLRWWEVISGMKTFTHFLQPVELHWEANSGYHRGAGSQPWVAQADFNITYWFSKMYRHLLFHAPYSWGSSLKWSLENLPSSALLLAVVNNTACKADPSALSALWKRFVFPNTMRYSKAHIHDCLVLHYENRKKREGRNRQTL